ncbi:TPA: serine acetyltransferase [Klebsiella quasipneumoniae subsp. similipneumoniae]
MKRSLFAEVKMQSSLKAKIIIFIFRLAVKSKQGKFYSPLFYFFHVLNILINETIFSVELPSSTQIGFGIKLYHPHAIVVHGGYIIGENLTLRQSTTIGSSLGKEHISSRIGNNVDIGAGVIIIGDDISIGDNVTFGAGVVVNKSIESNTIVVGNGFRVIKKGLS